MIYRKNPLEQVICQLRFPTILAISSNPPAAFQERLRDQYPLFTTLPQLPSANKIPREILKHLIPGSVNSLLGPPCYQMSSQDMNWVLQLNQDYISLTTRAYTRWEDFQHRVLTLIDALVVEYRPAFFDRIGLRYQDVIRREVLHLQESEWSTLLKPFVAGILNERAIAGSVRQLSTQALVSLDHYRAQVRISHGLAEDSKTRLPCYMIDSDFSTEEKIDVTDSIHVLQYFNRYAGRLFRWCISDTLHDAMDPQPTE
ncbi:MAG: TIGR04255 family protein [Armatimonadota bacterium]|nr:TIGR04255 family protein [Armatimonadota bacterium]